MLIHESMVGDGSTDSASWTFVVETMILSNFLHIPLELAYVCSTTEFVAANTIHNGP